jgi:hypothetical protein
MYHLEYSDFYITNVCNLNCTNCNHFNNFNFKGHFLWEDYKEQYTNWSKILKIDRIGILGGEPMNNPNMMNWIHGLAELWPKSKILIVTNGTQLKRWPNLYNDILRYNGRIELDINCHTPKDWFNMLSDAQNFLTYPIRKQKGNNPNSLVDWSEEEQLTNKTVGPSRFTDTNNISVNIMPAWSFMNSTINYDKKTGKMSVYDSNPEQAFAVCDFKHCNHFIKGKLHKCAPVGILPDFIEQFKDNIELTDSQKKLIYSYEPASYDWSKEKLDPFIDNIVVKRPIAQCNLCPQNKDNKPISAYGKKLIPIPVAIA